MLEAAGDESIDAPEDRNALGSIVGHPRRGPHRQANEPVTQHRTVTAIECRRPHHLLRMFYYGNTAVILSKMVLVTSTYSSIDSSTQTADTVTTHEDVFKLSHRGDLIDGLSDLPLIHSNRHGVNSAHTNSAATPS